LLVIIKIHSHRGNLLTLRIEGDISTLGTTTLIWAKYCHILITLLGYTHIDECHHLQSLGDISTLGAIILI